MAAAEGKADVELVSLEVLEKYLGSILDSSAEILEVEPIGTLGAART
jgi:hypothetical protein